MTLDVLTGPLALADELLAGRDALFEPRSPGPWPKLMHDSLPGPIKLRLAAGRARDEADVVRLMRASADRADVIRQHVAATRADYVTAFDRLLSGAREQQDE